MKRKNNPDRYQISKLEFIRDKDWATERIKVLDARLGEGKGAKRERERIADLLKKPAKANG